MSNPDRNKNLGFTLTELMVVIVILCCLATWVPMAWITPDKPKDLKAIEHLRAHAYLHNAFFGMTRRYPQWRGNVAPFPNDKGNYERLVIQKNPAIGTSIQIAFQHPFTGNINVTFTPTITQISGGETGLNQLTLNRNPGGGNFIQSFVEWKGTGSPDHCEKNSPLGLRKHFMTGTVEDEVFCRLDSGSGFLGNPSYRVIAMGPGSDTSLSSNREAAMFTAINGQNVMISHRCLGVMAPSSAIYIIHVAGGETIATAHIPAQVVKKATLFPFAERTLFSAALVACEDSTQDIETLLTGAIGFNFTNIKPRPGF